MTDELQPSDTGRTAISEILVELIQWLALDGSGEMPTAPEPIGVRSLAAAAVLNPRLINSRIHTLKGTTPKELRRVANEFRDRFGARIARHEMAVRQAREACEEREALDSLYNGIAKQNAGRSGRRQ